MGSHATLKVLIAGALSAAAVTGCGGGGSGFSLPIAAAPAPAPAPAAPPAPAPAPAQPPLLNNPDAAAGCAAVAALASELSATGRKVSVTSATLSKTTATDANGNPQTYCAVVGTINGGRAGSKAAGQTDAQTTYTIGFQINLPSTWNSRLFFSGGGGTDGSIPNTTGVITSAEAVNPLLSGYATVSDDSGSPGVAFFPHS